MEFNISATFGLCQELFSVE